MKTILITGASGNLGKVVTRFILANGYRVIAVVSKEESKSYLPNDPNLDIEVVNLARASEATNFINRVVEKYNRIDGAMLLAGGYDAGTITSTTIEQIQKQITLNFETAFNITQPLFLHMIQQNYGRIIFIGSRPALQASAGKHMLSYSLSKSLLFNLAEYLNSEAKGKNVTVTVVVPSTIDTEDNRNSMPGSNYFNWVKPENIAEILEFIISDKGDPLRETLLKIYNNA